MSYATEHISSNLKAARARKGLSQHELGKKAGVPQGHISKIENGAVDLRLSSLVALARALDLELMLVPRKAVPAVKSIVRSSERTIGKNADDLGQALMELKRFQESIASLTGKNLVLKDLEQIQRQTHSQLQRLRNALAHGSSNVPETEYARPAYSLDEDDHG